MSKKTDKANASVNNESENELEKESTVDVVESSDEKLSPIEEVELSKEEQLENKVRELEDKLVRHAAEFDNYKKRTARQYDDMIKFANERTILDMIEIIDNFDRALEHKDNEGESESFQKGIEMINNQMHSLLEKYQVTPIEALGKLFDPNFHEAMMHVESDEFEEGYVAFEMNKGYMMNSKVIRHSRVGVAKAKEEKTEEKQKEETEE